MTTWQESFWVRLGLQKTDKAEYIEAIKRRYDGHHVDEFEYQGYCSFTLLISWPVHSNTIDARTASDDHTPAAIIVQIRPTQHALDIAVAREANRLYASLAPEVAWEASCVRAESIARDAAVPAPATHADAWN
jgi:hypothetical protein